MSTRLIALSGSMPFQCAPRMHSCGQYDHGQSAWASFSTRLPITIPEVPPIRYDMHPLTECMYRMGRIEIKQTNTEYPARNPKESDCRCILEHSHEGSSVWHCGVNLRAIFVIYRFACSCTRVCVSFNRYGGEES